MELEKIKNIDFSKEIGVIKQKYGQRYFAEPKAVAEATAFWGVAANECGVIQDAKIELVVDGRPVKAEIRFVETKRGWLIGLSASTSHCGFAWPPSVWDARAFRTVRDARLAGIAVLCGYFNEQTANCSQSQEKAFRNAIRQLDGAKHPQLDLF